MGDGSDALAWIGLEQVDGGWQLPVHGGLVSGAGALFGGCATSSAISVARQVMEQPVLWVATHFGALAKHQAVVDLGVRTVSAGRTMCHLEVHGTSDGRESFTARVAAGERPSHDHQGQWATPPDVPAVAQSAPFDHPVHEGSWAARFEWRLAGASNSGTDPWAAWWVRSFEPIDPLTEAAVLCDYVTYGMGRALGRPMGGLSVDNVLRVHDPEPATEPGWRLLEVRPESIAGGFGFGHARLFADSSLIASGSQSVVMNNWDWRLPSEHAEPADS